MTIKDTEEKTLNTEIKDEETQPIEVYSEKAESAAPELDDKQIRAAALAYAKYLSDNNLKPGEPTFIFVDPKDVGAKIADLDEVEPVEELTEDVPEEEFEETPEKEEETAGEIHDEEAAAEEAAAEETSEESISEETSGDKPEEGSEAEASEAEAEDEKPEDGTAAEENSPAEDQSGEKAPEKSAPKKKKSKKNKQREENLRKIREREEAKEQSEKRFLYEDEKHPLAAITNLHDKVQDGVDGAFSTIGKDIIKGAHSISSTYRNSRKAIGIAVLLTGVIVAAILIVFDMFTVYEYVYNGKVLGYVKEQEEVTDVLDVAARNLSKNNNNAGVQFAVNQNITFNLVDSRGKSTDDSDTVVNKLIYMTDIETEAYAVYDGDKAVAVLKDEEDAAKLLKQTQDELSTPDRGMELVSSKFINDLSTRPVNVLLGSIKSNAAAKDLMINGGQMNTYHLVETGETAESLAQEFGVAVTDIYDENNKNVVEDIEQGDKVCIRSMVDPVSVEMVEKGSIKEVLRYETIKEETDEYYKGDAILKQEGQDGIQVFHGTITKVGGVETKRKASKEPEELQEKIDKIIIVGTAERPKTAATGTFIMPINSYVITSEFGGRWGRMHEGMDFGAGTGTPIYASDGGTVIRAGYFGGYGLCVDVDHGNGVFTRYGHCSAVFVSAGDLVYQGQHIAAVGSTGWSTGPHLHFEVRINGAAQNPRNYINP